jgi:hypothetical protein
MPNAMIYAGISIGVAVIATAVVYGTEKQQNYIPDDIVNASATMQGEINSESGWANNQQRAIAYGSIFR